MSVDGLSVADLREMLRAQNEGFQGSVDALYEMIDALEDEIAKLEAEKAALAEARDGLLRRQASLFEQTSQIAQNFLAKHRSVQAENAAIEEARKAGQTLFDRDGKPLKPSKVPEMKLLHKLTVQLRPAPLASLPVPTIVETASPAPSPPKKEGGFFSALKAKLKGDDDKSPPPPAFEEDPEGQAMCRFGLSLEHCPGNRFVDFRSQTPVEVASLCFGLRVASALNKDAVGASDAEELGAFINMSIHNALAAAADAAVTSELEKELRSSDVATRREELKQAIAAADEQRATASRILSSMIVDVTARPLEPNQTNPGATQCFNITVTIKQKPDPSYFASIEKVTQTEAYRAHKATAEKAYAILETFGLHGFSSAVDIGIAARPPPVQSEAEQRALAEDKRNKAVEQARGLWNKHRSVLADDKTIAKAVEGIAETEDKELRSGGAKSRSDVASEKLSEALTAARPAIMSMIDGFILPAVQRTVCPPAADANPLDKAPVAANLYQIQVFRAPRDMVKVAVNTMYDRAAVKAEERAVEKGDVQRGAAVKLAAAKTKVSAALGLYDDLHFDVVPFGYKTSVQKKKAATLLKRAELNASQAVSYLSQQALIGLREVLQERQAVIDAEASEGAARSALKDAASVVAAVARAIAKLADTPDPKTGIRQLSRESSRYDLHLCVCEGAAPLVASFVVKPPPSMLATVESTRASFVLGIAPATLTATCFTGRPAGRPCRCGVFNAPLQLLLADTALKICELVDKHSPLDGISPAVPPKPNRFMEDDDEVQGQ